MACILVKGAGLQNTPLVLTGVGKIDMLAFVIGHVHALIRKTLVRDVLQSKFQFEQVIIMAQGNTERMVDGLVQGGANLVRIRHADGTRRLCRVHA